MSIETTAEQDSLFPEVSIGEPPMPPSNLVFDDGELVETNRHRIAMNVLIRSVQQALAARSDFFAGAICLFVYYSRNQAMHRDFRGPDFFVALDVDGNRDRQGWVVWEENGRYPDVIVELLSPSTATVDRGAKKELYERIFRTPDYFIFDPFHPNSLEGWHLELGRGYQTLQRNERGWLCARLWDCGWVLGKGRSTANPQRELVSGCGSTTRLVI